MQLFFAACLFVFYESIGARRRISKLKRRVEYKSIVFSSWRREGGIKIVFFLINTKSVVCLFANERSVHSFIFVIVVVVYLFSQIERRAVSSEAGALGARRRDLSLS